VSFYGVDIAAVVGARVATSDYVIIQTSDYSALSSVQKVNVQENVASKKAEGYTSTFLQIESYSEHRV